MSLLGPISTLGRYRDEVFAADFLSGVPAGLTLSRASSAMYWDADGVYKVAADNQPRIEYDPLTRRPLGLLCEVGTSNVFSYSNDFLNAAWVFAGATRAGGFLAPNGKKEAVVFSGSSSGPSMRSWSVTQAGKVTFSVFVNPLGNTQPRPFLIRNGTTATNVSQATFDPGNGTIVNGGGAGVWRAERLPGGWWRISGTASATFAVGDSAVFYYGFTTGSITSMPPMAVWGGQGEMRPFVTSLVPTVATAGTRALELPSFTMEWYRDDVGGTLLVEAAVQADHTITGTISLAVMNDGGNNNRAGIYLGSGSNDARIQAVVGVAGETALSTLIANRTDLFNGVPFKTALQFDGTGAAFRINGLLTGSAARNCLPIGMKTLGLFLGGQSRVWYRNLRFYAKNMDGTTLTAR